MAMMTHSAIGQIGETAGEIWHFLNENGPTSVSGLVNTIDAPRDLVMQGLGWLAREDKVDVEETKRGKIVMLRPAC